MKTVDWVRTAVGERYFNLREVSDLLYDFMMMMFHEKKCDAKLFLS